MIADVNPYSETTTPLNEVRTELLNLFINFGAVLSSTALVLLIVEAAREGRLTARLVLGLVITGFIWPLALNRYWPHKLRAAVLLAVLILPAIASQILYGIGGIGPFFWAFAAVFSIFVIDVRLGWLVTAVGTLSYAFTGWFVFRYPALLPPAYLARMELLVAGQTAIANAIIFATISILVVLGLNLVFKTIHTSIKIETELAETIENDVVELEDRVARRLNMIETGAAINRHISSLLSEKELVELVVSVLINGRHYTWAAVYFTQEEELVRYEPGIDPGQREVIPLGQGFIGQVARSGEAALTPVSPGERSAQDEWASAEIKWAAAAPILLRGETLGVLAVQNGTELTDDDIFLLTLIANQLAVGLRNARIFHRTSLEAKYQLTLTKINERLKEARTIQHVLQIASEELADSLNSPRVDGHIGRFYNKQQQMTPSSRGGFG